MFECSRSGHVDKKGVEHLPSHTRRKTAPVQWQDVLRPVFVQFPFTGSSRYRIARTIVLIYMPVVRSQSRQHPSARQSSVPCSKHAVVDHHVLEVSREAPYLIQTSRPDVLLRITQYKHCRAVYLIQASKPYSRTVTLTCSMAPSRLKLVDTCHVPSSVTLNP